MLDPASVRLTFDGELVYWRGPSPFHFVAVPPDGAELLHAGRAGRDLRLGRHPGDGHDRPARRSGPRCSREDGGYLVPVKDAVRRAERLELGDSIDIELTIRT